jgi:hypothetical protein
VIVATEGAKQNYMFLLATGWEEGSEDPCEVGWDRGPGHRMLAEVIDATAELPDEIPWHHDLEGKAVRADYEPN